MSFTANGTTYSHKTVVSKVEAGNKLQNNSGDARWLTQTEMDEIIAAAKEKGIEIVPLLNPEEDAQALTARLAELGAQALAETVEDIARGTAARTPQDHTQSTYAPMLTREMSAVDWTLPAQQIHDQVRGLIPWPCAVCELGGQTLKLFSTRVGGETAKAPGCVIGAGKQGIEVACGDGRVLRILELQAQGGRRMAAADYLRGHEIPVCL